MTYEYNKAEIIADSDSTGTNGARITTFILQYPRYIHAEFMTHRQFSRNAQSTRAIPTKNRILKIRTNPVLPIAYQKNQRGMVAKDEVVKDPVRCEAIWKDTADIMASVSEELMNEGLHKQWTGRMLEPFDTITVICTATDYENFFALRCADDAQPEINDLAWKMADLYYNSTPVVLGRGDWHLPFITDERIDKIDEYLKNHEGSKDEIERKVSAACCARVSYLNHDGSGIDIEKDIILHDRLVESGHMTPLEHQATPQAGSGDRFTGNFRGWVQYRKMISGECRGFNYLVEKERRNASV